MHKRKIPLLVCLFVLWLPVSALLLAQEAGEGAQASLSVVNAVPGPNNVFVSFDGGSIWPPGFTPGQSTAAVLFPAGKKSVQIQCEGFATVEANMDLPAGANCAMIIYPGAPVAEGPDRGKRKLSVFVPPSHPPGSKQTTGQRWKIILVGTEQSAELEVNGKKVLLTPRKSIELEQSGAGLEVKYQGKAILGAIPEDSGEYWAVVFPAEGGLGAVLHNHSAFKVES
jgi:hypothetical protein